MERRTLLKAGLVAPAAAVLPGTVSPAEAAPRVSTTLTHGLDTPWNIAFLPTGDALVTQRDSGLITRVSRHGGRTTVGHVPGVEADGEGGLLGLALHPNFSSNRLGLHLLTSARRQPDRAGALQRRPARRCAGDPDRHPQEQPSTTAAAWRSGRTGCSTPASGTARSRRTRQNRNSLGRQDPPDHDERRRGAGQPVRQPRSGPTATATPRGSRSAPTGGSGPASSAQNTYDELNQIVKGANYGWPRVEGERRPRRLPRPAHPVVHRPVLAERHRRAARPRLARRPARRVPVVGAAQRPQPGQKTRYFFQRFGRIRAVAAAPDGSLWIGTSNRDGRGTPAGADDRIIRILL